MRTRWHEMWGSGRGPVTRLAPQSRILVGAALFGACLTAPARSPAGAGFIGATALGWLLACGMPRRAAGSFLFLGLAMFLPYFLLVPFLGGSRTAVPTDILVHGLAGVLVAAAGVTTLSLSDFRRGLLALPLPRVATAVVVQIVHQASELVSETGRVMGALAVRGGSGGGRAARRALVSLPRVWLPRVVGRAERVAAAMELRGYAEADLRVFGRRPLRAEDLAAIAGGLAWLAVAAGLRWRLFG
jgi:energy-coupling factor transporter transmembrane protein EcfT